VKRDYLENCKKRLENEKFLRANKKRQHSESFTLRNEKLLEN